MRKKRLENFESGTLPNKKVEVFVDTKKNGSDGYFSCPLEIYLFEIAEALVLSNWGNQRPNKRIIKGKTKGSLIQQVERGILEISITQKGTHRVTPPETYIYSPWK